MDVALGGTFDPVHDGHRRLFERAFELGDVTIGLTSDELAPKTRHVERHVNSYDERANALEKALEPIAAEYDCEFEIRPLEEPTGIAIEPQFDYLVVSPKPATAASGSTRSAASGDTTRSRSSSSLISVPMTVTSFRVPGSSVAKSTNTGEFSTAEPATPNRYFVPHTGPFGRVSRPLYPRNGVTSPARRFESRLEERFPSGLNREPRDVGRLGNLALRSTVAGDQRSRVDARGENRPLDRSSSGTSTRKRSIAHDRASPRVVVGRPHSSSSSQAAYSTRSRALCMGHRFPSSVINLLSVSVVRRPPRSITVGNGNSVLLEPTSGYE